MPKSRCVDAIHLVSPETAIETATGLTRQATADKRSIHRRPRQAKAMADPGARSPGTSPRNDLQGPDWMVGQWH
jgi:hypothetical protein